MTDTQSTPGTGQGGGQKPPITDPYRTVGGDSLPDIAERAGHAGEWQALALANIGAVDVAELDDSAKMQVVAERAQRAGVELVLPSDWTVQAATAPAEQHLGELSASQLVQLAQDAQTLAELDAIDAVAGGRVTVQNAVDARRQALLDQGAIA